MKTLMDAHTKLLKAYTSYEVRKAVNFVSARIEALAYTEQECRALRDRASRAASEAVGPYWSFLTDVEQAESGIVDATGGPESAAAAWLNAQAEIAEAERNRLLNLVYRSKQDLQATGANLALSDYACKVASINTSLFL